MKIVIGLGNPGDTYALTRHNAGFMALDFLLVRSLTQPSEWKTKFHSQISETIIDERKALLIKPQTFMNDSGTAVREIVDFYKANASRDVLVLHDEVDLPFGTLRTTESSSPAGHNGIKSIIEHLGTQDFHRLRIGVETRESRNQLATDVFVLQRFTEAEIKKLEAELFPALTIKVTEFLKK